MVLAMLLGITGLGVGFGLFKLGLLEHPIVKLINNLVISAVLVTVFMTAISTDTPGFIQTIIDFLTQYDALVALAIGLATGTALQNFFK